MRDMTMNMLQVIKAGAAKAVADDPHPVRDMPRCQWYGQHRYKLDHLLPDGTRVERCMDCEIHTRVVS